MEKNMLHCLLRSVHVHLYGTVLAGIYVTVTSFCRGEQGYAQQNTCRNNYVINSTNFIYSSLHLHFIKFQGLDMFRALLAHLHETFTRTEVR
jgi:hypothetical protein